ncbi:MAG: hypothetical protein V9E87_07190 [Gemmatimonadales bacterium]
MGEMLITTADLADKALAERLAAPARYSMLPVGTELLVGLKAVTRDDHLCPTEEGPRPIWLGELAPLWLEEPLDLEVTAALSGRLCACRCSSPALNGRHAVSLNHGFTLLSERYETDRLSHTGNVFKRVFFFDEILHRWLPLEEQRSRVLQLAADEYAALAKQSRSGA